MLSKQSYIEEKLKHIVEINEESEIERNYDWITNYYHINFWEFLLYNYLDLDRFFTMLDVEQGPTAGWEKFMENLGMKLWEDRMWCMKYHNGIGPLRAALIKLIGKKEYDFNLNLSFVLDILMKMQRFDILLQIDWQYFAEKLHKNKILPLPPKEIENILVCKLNQPLELNIVKCQLVMNSNNFVGQNDSKQNEDLYKPSKKEKPKSLPCIMMCYAEDGQKYADKLAEHLRTPVGNDGVSRFRVVLLGEPKVRDALAADPNNMLHKWFQQVRYIVPVLSPQYLKQIQNLSSSSGLQNRDWIAIFNRLVYRFLLDQFVSFGSRNLRCRPVCPKEFYSEVSQHSVFCCNGLFVVHWGCDSPEEREEVAAVLSDKPLV